MGGLFRRDARKDMPEYCRRGIQILRTRTVFNAAQASLDKTTAEILNHDCDLLYGWVHSVLMTWIPLSCLYFLWARGGIYNSADSRREFGTKVVKTFKHKHDRCSYYCSWIEQTSVLLVRLSIYLNARKKYLKKVCALWTGVWSRPLSSPRRQNCCRPIGRRQWPIYRTYEIHPHVRGRGYSRW